MKYFHAVMTIAWLLMMPISLYFGWVTSVTYVSVLSIYALFAAHFASWQAVRTEERQDEIEEQRQAE